MHLSLENDRDIARYTCSPNPSQNGFSETFLFDRLLFVILLGTIDNLLPALHFAGELTYHVDLNRVHLLNVI